MNKMFSQWVDFDEMITPKIIKIIYWFLLFITVVGGIIGMIANPFVGLIGLIMGVVGLRIGCEMIILFFNIYQQVKKIADAVPNKINGDAEGSLLSQDKH
ncbi:DUF4282 domain-containing protein [Escherichia coli]|uniref:DUF4282 domain-containing protein n=1 Tax=Escherichia coli TaxID=562 RepID=UPI0010E01617|nr:DUF4282 domain-containing protein [Escherichia coli]GDM23247.1 hypothetical protein BvCmsNSNP012_04827 [Escherichia coli]